MSQEVAIVCAGRGAITAAEPESAQSARPALKLRWV